MSPSMSRPWNCLDNACIESFFSHLKTEALSPIRLEIFRRHEDGFMSVSAFITRIEFN